MSNKYYQKILPYFNKKDINDFLNNIDYKQLTLEELSKFFPKPYSNIKSKTLIKFIDENSDKFKHKNFNIDIIYDYNFNHIYEKIDKNVYNEVIQYFLNNKDYNNIFLLNMIIFNMFEYLDLIEKDKILSKLLIDTINKNFDIVEEYLIELFNKLIYLEKDNTNIFDYPFIVELIDNLKIYKIKDNIENDLIFDIDNEFILKIYYINKINLYIQNSNSIEDIFSRLFKDIKDNETIYIYITEYLEQLIKNVNQISNEDFKLFKKEILYFVSTDGSEESEYYLEDIDDLLSQIGSLLYDKDGLNNILDDLDKLNESPLIMQRFHIIEHNTNIERKLKLNQFSILMLCLLKNCKKNEIEKLLSTNKSPYIYTAIVNINSLMKDIDILNISEKNRFNLLKLYKSVKAEKYKEYYNISINYLKDLKNIINDIDI